MMAPGDEKVVESPDQLANHADSLWARVEMDVLFSLFSFQGPLLKNSGAKND